MDDANRLVGHFLHSDLDGLDEIEDQDVITGAVVLLRVERPEEPGSALVVASNVDFFSQLGMLHAAIGLVDEE